MTWNYRVIKHEDEIAGEIEESLGIHEVYYNDDGSLWQYTADPVGVVADSVAELKEVLAMMAKAIELPVLEKGDFNGEADSC